MLITERIATDKRFLHFNAGLLGAFKAHPFAVWLKDFRQEILNSEKFIIPDYMSGSEETTRKFIGKIIDLKEIGTPEHLARLDQYVKFSKPCFKYMTIENNDICYAIEQTSFGFAIILINKDGEVNPIQTMTWKTVPSTNGMKMHEFLYNFLLGTKETSVSEIDVFLKLRESDNITDRYITYKHSVSLRGMLCVLEILLYINAKNRREVEVKIPLGVHKKRKRKSDADQKGLIYKVLVLDRTKPTLVTSKDISDYIYSPEEEHAKRRATYVRGHLKVRKTGTYWWNPFIRDAKNALTVGMVDKTYDVKIPQT